MKHALRVRPSAHHVHVDSHFDALGEVRFRIQQGSGAFNLRWPDEAEGPGRSRELAVGDQLPQSSRDFENGDTPAGVVVGAWPLMIEVTRIGDLSVWPRSAINSCCYYFVVGRVLPRLHPGMQPNLLAMKQPVFQRPCRPQ